MFLEHVCLVAGLHCSILVIVFPILAFFVTVEDLACIFILLHVCNIGICGGDRRPARYDDFGELSPSPCKLFAICRCLL